MARFRFHRLFHDPYVAVVQNGDIPLVPGIRLAAHEAQGRQAHLIVRLAWESTAESIDRLRQTVSHFTALRPNLSFVVMAESDEAETGYRAAGLDAFVCNANAFTDERLFYPTPRPRKAFDAVYNARLVPFKQHWLAARTRRLALVTADFGVEPEFARKTLTELKDAVAYCNFDSEAGRVRWLSEDKVRIVLDRSWCGLALSAVEGAMAATSEYLLAGLPVVTIPSRGGRAEFFSPDYVATVAPDPQAVAEAVERFKTAPPDPVMIRSRTLERMATHRARLLERLSPMIGQDALAMAGPSLWLPQFINKLIKAVVVPDEMVAGP